MGNWSIQRKTMAALGAALVVLVAVIAVSYLATESFVRSTARVSDSFEIIAAQERLYSDLIDLMWNQRTYIADGSAAELSARNAARDRLVAQSTLLPTMPFVRSVEQQRRVALLSAAVTEQLSILDEGLQSRGGADLSAERRESLRIRGRDALIRIRTTLDQIESDERKRVAEFLSDTQAGARRLYGTIVIIGALFLLSVGWLLRRLFADLEARDVVERKLHQANAFLESLLENIPTMVFVKDAAELRFVRFNRAGEQLLGYPRDQLIGKNDRDFFPHEQADFFIGKDREVIAHNKVADIPEEEIDTLMQGRRILHTRKVPIYDSDGRPSMLLGISMDITEQKLSEREVHKLNEELKQKADLLLAANQELESFCYSVSHDLRAPLRAIDGYAGILEQDYGGLLEGNAKRLLQGIHNNSRHMAELIDDLLEFSRLGRQVLDVSAVDMTMLAKQAANEIVEGTSSMPASQTPTIVIENLDSTHGDSRALYHVWLNLIDNAVKYSGRAEAPTITACAARSGREIIYSVRDNGVGFDMQYSDKLFGVFERLHSSKDYPGTGVGLAIVKRVVARHGGRVWADSKPGQGATFYFALPIIS